MSDSTVDRSSEPLYECNACDWIGPGRETVHPKHDETCWVCPECHETIAPVVGRPSKPTDTWKDRALEMCALLDKWSIYMQLAGTKPVSGDVRDNPVLALLADTRACLRKPVPADETPDCPKCIAVRKLGLRACQAHLPAVETPDGVSVAEFVRYRSCLYRANGRLIQLGQEPEKLDYPERPAENGDAEHG